MDIRSSWGVAILISDKIDVKPKLMGTVKVVLRVKQKVQDQMVLAQNSTRLSKKS